MDILFQKWWQSAFVRPLEHGMMKSSVMDESLDNTLKQILKILKAVLYGKPLEDQNPGTTQINEFIVAKKFSINVKFFIGKL